MAMQRTMKYDEATDTMVFKAAEDHRWYWKFNHHLATLNDGYSPSKEFRRAASIPPLIVEKWWNEEGIDVYNDEHWDAIAKKLDDPQYAFLRTAPGRISRRPWRDHFSGAGPRTEKR